MNAEQAIDKALMYLRDDTEPMAARAALAQAALSKYRAEKCPTCGSTAPHLHPATGFEGEVFVCVDDFHLRETPQNLAHTRQMVIEERQRRAAHG